MMTSCRDLGWTWTTWINWQNVILTLRVNNSTCHPRLRLVGQYHPFLLHHHHHHCHQNANNTNANPTHVLSHKSQGIPCNWSGTMNKKGLPISYPVHFEQTSYVYHHIFGCTPNLLYKMRTVNTKQY